MTRSTIVVCTALATMLQHQRLTFQHVSNLHRTSLVFIEVFFFLFFSERASPVPFFPATLFFFVVGSSR